MIPQNVIITNRLEDTINDFFQSVSYSNTAVLVDENTLKYCYPKIKRLLPPHSIIEIPAGEIYKNIETCSRIWQHITDLQFDRNALIINLGGGVIGDMGGFCASTYKRGIDFINIPTTLLAQVDAAVGGKLGIDFNGFKNHIGLFKDPEKVIIDPEFLQTLSKRELRSGFAEVIKHSLIADKIYWPNISDNAFDQQDWKAHIAHSVQVKAKIVSEDFKEKGLRKILNFGHTIGHAIESYFLGKPNYLLHGEAIAAGMICELYLSAEKCFLPEEQVATARKFILNMFDFVEIEEKSIPQIARLASQDKKNESNKILCTLLSEIGTSEFDIQISQQDIIDALWYYKKLKVNQI